MGKRKSRGQPAPKKRMDKLESVFCCPFCNHGSSVECRIQEEFGWYVGSARKGSALLSQEYKLEFYPIRYSEWIDEYERVNNFDDEAFQL